ncbi:VOC family protein [Raineyella fluvialis]|nr:VOC family protein [Raineyella fluvialis]
MPPQPTGAIPHHLDHLVFATPDLPTAVASLEEAIGVRATPGGRHPGRGTRNYLISFSDTSYLEIIGPDDEAEADASDGSTEAKPFGLNELDEPVLRGWAVHPADLDEAAVAARRAGADLGDPWPVSRRTPEGTLLRWRLASRHPAPFDGVVPFLIDWGQTAHPASSGLPAARLESLTLRHTNPAAATHVLTALGVDLPVAAGRPGLTAVVSGPKGSIVLS